MSDQIIRAWRGFAAWTFLRVVALVVLYLALVRIVIPTFINFHDDTALGIAVVCAVASPVIIGWLGVSLFLSVRRFPAKLKSLKGKSE